MARRRLWFRLVVCSTLIFIAQDAGSQEDEPVARQWQSCEKPFCGAHARFRPPTPSNATGGCKAHGPGNGMRILAVSFNMAGSGFSFSLNNTFVQVLPHP